MASSSAPRKRGLGRGPNQIPKAPANPDERILIQMRPHPDSTDFADSKIVKCISQLCLQNWPTPATTWASTPLTHKDAVWTEFQKRYRWDDAHASIIQTIFWQKCAVRTKDNLSKERQKALQNAQIDHPGQAEEYMHEYSPWWCAPTIWAGMCEQWKAESWVKRRRTAAVNRASGASEGNKAPGTYKGGSISQLQHVAAREASSQGQPIHWLDVNVATRDGLPEAVRIVETYNTLMDERYPEGIPRPPIDQELWERASVVKKNYIKGQGQRRRPTMSGTGSSSSQSTQSSCHPMPHTAADCARVICRDRDLLRTLRVHLQSLDSDELAEAVATAAQQETADQDQGMIMTATETEGKSSDVKDKGLVKSKGSSGNTGLASGKSGDGGKAASGSANDGASQSGESGSEGSSDASDENNNHQEFSAARKKSFDQMIADGANAQHNNTVHYSGSALESSFSARGQPAAKLPITVPGKPAVTVPTTRT